MDEPIAAFGWELQTKDRGIMCRHLDALNSAHARPEAPGEAGADKDYAIHLYQKTLFAKVFKENAKAATEETKWFGAIQFEVGLKFPEERGKSGKRFGLRRPRAFNLHVNVCARRSMAHRRPLVEGCKGKNIIGALSYLASKKLNAVHILTMNANGGGNDLWPWLSPTNAAQFDYSKFDQRNLVFNQMGWLGLKLLLLLQEEANERFVFAREYLRHECELISTKCHPDFQAYL